MPETLIPAPNGVRIKCILVCFMMVIALCVIGAALRPNPTLFPILTPLETLRGQNIWYDWFVHANKHVLNPPVPSFPVFTSMTQNSFVNNSMVDMIPLSQTPPSLHRLALGVLCNKGVVNFTKKPMDPRADAGNEKYDKRKNQGEVQHRGGKSKEKIPEKCGLKGEEKKWMNFKNKSCFPTGYPNLFLFLAGKREKNTTKNPLNLFLFLAGKREKNTIKVSPNLFHLSAGGQQSISIFLSKYSGKPVSSAPARIDHERDVKPPFIKGKNRQIISSTGTVSKIGGASMCEKESASKAQSSQFIEFDYDNVCKPSKGQINANCPPMIPCCCNAKSICLQCPCCALRTNSMVQYVCCAPLMPSPSHWANNSLNVCGEVYFYPFLRKMTHCFSIFLALDAHLFVGSQIRMNCIFSGVGLPIKTPPLCGSPSYPPSGAKARPGLHHQTPARGHASTSRRRTTKPKTQDQ